MCDELTERDVDSYLHKNGLSRRTFNKAGLGAAVATMLPATASAVDTTGSDVTITTPDGEADAWFVHPAEGASAVPNRGRPWGCTKAEAALTRW